VARRKEVPGRAAVVGSGAVPGWLLRFDPQCWRGETYVARRRAWSDAGHAWLRAGGFPVSDWYLLVHPESAAHCGLRLRGDYARDGGGRDSVSAPPVR